MGRSKKRILIAEHILIGSIIALPWLWLCWYYWSYYPLWDGAIYYEEALEAARTTLNPLAYNIAGHPTMGYLWLPSVLTRLLGRSYRVFLVYNAVLGWVMSIAIADIAMRLHTRERQRLELMLIVGAAMYCPVVVASIVQLSPDFGVLVFLTLVTRALIRARFVQAVVWGVLAGLSKESGTLLFGVETLLYLVVYCMRAPDEWSDKINKTLRRSPLLLASLVAPVAIRLFADSSQSKAWINDGSILVLVRQFMTISFMDNLLPASLATILVLNCMWIPVAFVILYFGVWCVRRMLLGFQVSARRDPAVEFVATVFVAELLLLTRFRTFTNVRYYLPLFPWILMLAARGLCDMVWPRSLRLFGLGGTLLALGLSNFRSFDPVSARIFGTIPFGEHRLVHITSLTGECCGLGRDQLVYNLEFAELDRLLRDVFPYVLSSKDHAIALHPLSDWYLFNTIHPRTMRRATSTKGSFRLPYTSAWAVSGAPIKPEKIHYIALPNMPDAEELGQFSKWYKINVGARRFSDGGYYIDVHELVLKH